MKNIREIFDKKTKELNRPLTKDEKDIISINAKTSPFTEKESRAMFFSRGSATRLASLSAAVYSPLYCGESLWMRHTDFKGKNLNFSVFSREARDFLLAKKTPISDKSFFHPDQPEGICVQRDLGQIVFLPEIPYNTFSKIVSIHKKFLFRKVEQAAKLINHTPSDPVSAVNFDNHCFVDSITSWIVKDSPSPVIFSYMPKIGSLYSKNGSRGFRAFFFDNPPLNSSVRQEMQAGELDRLVAFTKKGNKKSYIYYTVSAYVSVSAAQNILLHFPEFRNDIKLFVRENSEILSELYLPQINDFPNPFSENVHNIPEYLERAVTVRILLSSDLIFEAFNAVTQSARKYLNTLCKNHRPFPSPLIEDGTATIFTHRQLLRRFKTI